MLRNPFKGLRKLDYLIVGILLLTALGNWLLQPYKNDVKEFLTNWPPVISYIVLAAFVNVIVAVIAVYIAGDKSENWWVGKQPQSAWSRAYLETIENEEGKNKWVEKAMNIWLISILASFFIIGMVMLINLLFTQTANMFIIYLAAYLLGRAVPNLGNLKWKRKKLQKSFTEMDI